MKEYVPARIGARITGNESHLLGRLKCFGENSEVSVAGPLVDQYVKAKDEVGWRRNVVTDEIGADKVPLRFVSPVPLDNDIRDINAKVVSYRDRRYDSDITTPDI